MLVSTTLCDYLFHCLSTPNRSLHTRHTAAFADLSTQKQDEASTGHALSVSTLALMWFANRHSVDKNLQHLPFLKFSSPSRLHPRTGHYIHRRQPKNLVSLMPRLCLILISPRPHNVPHISLHAITRRLGKFSLHQLMCCQIAITLNITMVLFVGGWNLVTPARKQQIECLRFALIATMRANA
jgi:hypothetical protein